MERSRGLRLGRNVERIRRRFRKNKDLNKQVKAWARGGSIHWKIYCPFALFPPLPPFPRVAVFFPTFLSPSDSSESSVGWFFHFKSWSNFLAKASSFLSWDSVKASNLSFWDLAKASSFSFWDLVKASSFLSSSCPGYLLRN